LALDLCLPAASGPSVGAGARRGQPSCGSIRTAEAAASLLQSGNLLVLHLNESALGAWATLNRRLLVGGKVERDEEQQVAGQNANSSNSSKLLTSAGARIGHPREVSMREVGVRSEINKA